MAARFNCLRCGRRLDRFIPAETSAEAGLQWISELDSPELSGHLCPRCAEWHAARARLWNIAWTTLVFAGVPAGVAAFNVIR